MPRTTAASTVAPNKLTRRSLYWYAALAMVVWCAVLVLSLWYTIASHQRHVDEIAREVAIAVHNKDHAFRLWASSLKGIYIPVTPDTPPSPWLAHLPARDITTPGGLPLTLVNAAQVQRLVNRRFSELSGFAGKVTSFQPLRPDNAPDPWESAGLRALEGGAQTVAEKVLMDGKAFMRVMRPFRLKQSCLGCHAYQGVKVGDVVGADSTAVPMAPLARSMAPEITRELLNNALFLLIGAVTIAFVTQRVGRGLDDRDRNEARIIASRDYTRAVIGALGEGVYGVDSAGHLTFLNPEGERLLGWKESELLGKSVHEHMHYRHADGSPYPSETCPFLHVLHTGERFTSEQEVFLRKNGQTFPVECISTPLQVDGDVAGSIISFQDITLRRQAEEKIHFLAHHDGLTQLPNRSMLMEFLRHHLAQSRRHGGAVALLFIDLDKFSHVNDSYGHFIGDELLREVVKRFGHLIREPDMLARQGGDEFIVLLTQPGEQAASQDVSVDTITKSAQQVAERLLEAIRPPFHLSGNEFFVNASIGISVYPKDAGDGVTLLKNADSAMYHVKENGGGGHAVFAGELYEQSKRRFELENRLHRAVREREFLLHYQPIIDLANGGIVGAEALVRWESPEEGLIPPDEFIPLAERTGMIEPIGQWVLKSACAQMARWKAQGHRIYVAINISAVQLLGGQLAQEVMDAIAASGLDKDMLELEITEGAVVKDPTQAQKLLNRIYEHGIRLALDDFGTGYSSLSRLRELPFSTLKIDRSFVSGVPDTRDDMEIVISTIQLARNLDKRPLAEGIETPEQHAFLLKQGCTLGQGFHFSRPVPAGIFEQMLSTGRRWPVPEVNLETRLQLVSGSASGQPPAQDAAAAKAGQPRKGS